MADLIDPMDLPTGCSPVGCPDCGGIITYLHPQVVDITTVWQLHNVVGPQLRETHDMVREIITAHQKEAHGT